MLPRPAIGSIWKKDGKVREILKTEVSQEWKDFWNEWPLHFIVFHDFILRYPNSEEAVRAKDRLLHFIREDIVGIRETESDEFNLEMKRDMILKKIYDFLAKEYNQLLTENIKKEVYGYIE